MKGRGVSHLLVFCMLLALPVYVFAMHVPSSHRSEEAIKRVKPLLENELIQIGVTWGAPVYIRIFKDEKLLELWVRHMDRFVFFKSYEVCNFGPNGLGPKVRRGDMGAPEGFYHVTASALNPNSSFHLSFNIGYPNSYDTAQGWTGSAIMIHGHCKSWGCFALSDRDVEEVYALVDAGLKNGQSEVPVHIFPFRMTIEKMNRYRGHKWEQFWKNLKEGYDLFEKDGFRPPIPIVQNKMYVFQDRMDGGYNFDRTQVYEYDGFIRAVAWFVPQEKQYFRQYFDDDLYRAFSPYLEEYHLMIEPKKHEFTPHLIIVRDRYGRALEVVNNGSEKWQSIESASYAMRDMLSQVMTYHYQNKK